MSAPRYKWQPTTSDIARAAGIEIEDVIRFDHNTSPTPTHWAAELAALSARSLNEYPGADYRPIREAAAHYAGVSPDRVAVGAGVDELILLAGRAFLRSGQSSVAITPTYPLYEIATLQVGATFNAVASPPPDFVFPAEEMVEAARTADVTWVCVPNNPTGVRPDDPTIAAIIDAAGGIVVLDAAYAEFCGDDWVPTITAHPHVFAFHTLSKGFGLAGLRVGFGLGSPEMVDAIDAVRPPGSIASISVDVATAALGQPQRMRDNVAEVVTQRTLLAERLTGLGFRVVPSQTNFLLCEVGDTARPIGESLMTEGLVVRMYPTDGPLGTYLRFTVRSASENDRLVAALERKLA